MIFQNHQNATGIHSTSGRLATGTHARAAANSHTGAVTAMARATIIDFGDLDDTDDDDFTLTLVGGGLDITLTVIDG